MLQNEKQKPKPKTRTTAKHPPHCPPTRKQAGETGGDNLEQRRLKSD